jgi:hypothetical protein
MRSSIFSFEHFRRYAALPRAERRWHAAVAAVLAAVVLLAPRLPALVYGASGCPNGTLGSAAVASLSDRTQVLFVGSSHVLFGIRPERYSVRAMNLATTWLDYTCARRVVEKHLPRVPDLKVAVIEYDELPLVADLVPGMIHAKDISALADLALCPLEMPAANPFQTLQVLYTAWASPLYNLPRLTPLGWQDRATVCSPLRHPPRGFSAGYYYTEGVTPASYDANAVYAALTKSARDAQVVDRNRRALQQTISMLRARGIKVVLLRLPHARDYVRPAIVAERWRELESSVAAQRRADAGLLVLDWGSNAEFQPRDFVDNHHLNAAGADKLAGLLDGRLRALCGAAR